MKRAYVCPKCHGLLNPGTKVIFLIEHEQDHGLVLLSPQLGDYAVVMGETLALEPGMVCRFRCPICHADLTSKADRHLVEVECHHPDGGRSIVSFSRVAGEHATFVRDAHGVESFGEHAGRYEPVNFFGAGKD